MAIKDYFCRNRENGLWSVEILTVIYMIFTTLLIFIHWDGLANPTSMLITRGVVFGIMAILLLIYRLYPCRALRILRFLPSLLCLIAWYPETYDFCSQYPYLDHVFAEIDETLFGCQPAFEFSRFVSSTFWSEAFNLGYYSYYYMMGLTLLFYLFFRYDKSDKASFVFLSTFFVYYIIYEFLPVAGPQYYFKAVGLDVASAGGPYPSVGYYFQTHTEMLPTEIKGIFSQLVVGAQEVGERPTAAFPSSHVGMSTVTMILAYRTGNKWLFWLMTPLYVLLCCATVYIQAHYLIDSIAGLITAFLFYYLMSKVYGLTLGKNKK